MYHILLVEDDSQIREVITDYVSQNGEGELVVYSAIDGKMGLEKINERNYDLVLLDIMLPDFDGFTICREIRKKSIVPIIFLTARGLEEDILFGYKLGCDDYIVKPFSLATLYAKIQALLKRSKGLIGATVLTCGLISLNPVSYEVTVGYEASNIHKIDLPPKQYTLLKYLIENKNSVISRDVLLNQVWGYDYMGQDRVVDNHIKKLRKALGLAGKQIKTVIGAGYKIEG